MKSSIKIMLLGITVMLFGIYLRCLFIEHLYSFFIELIWTVLPIIGLLIAVWVGNRHKNNKNNLLKRRSKHD